jgi:hypothetical protein
MEDRTQEEVWFVALEAGGLVAAGARRIVTSRRQTRGHTAERRGARRGRVAGGQESWGGGPIRRAFWRRGGRRPGEEHGGGEVMGWRLSARVVTGSLFDRGWRRVD